MKKVLKNMFKSISIVCFIIVIIVTIVLGIKGVMISNWINIENNGEIPIVQDSDYVVNNFIGNVEDNIENEKVYQRFTSYAIYILPIALGFEMGSTILVYSIIIGGIIGIAISIDEFSKKRLLVTYLGVYTIVLIILYFIEMKGYAVGYYILSGFEFAIKLFIIYTIIFGISIYSKRLFNKMQSKMLNNELKD